MWQLWINFVIGLWVIISGLIAGVQHEVNLIICGIVVAVLGFWAGKKWQGLVAGIVGVWLFISGLVHSTLGKPWNYIIFGLVVAVLCLWAALEKKEVETPQTPPTT